MDGCGIVEGHRKTSSVIELLTERNRVICMLYRAVNVAKQPTAHAPELEGAGSRVMGAVKELVHVVSFHIVHLRPATGMLIAGLKVPREELRRPVAMISLQSVARVA